MDIGKRIKQMRTEKGISADWLAARAGVSRSSIFRYENGSIEKVPTEAVKKIAKALNTTPADLMGWQKSPINEIFEKLNSKRKEKVVDYANRQLNEQKAAANFPNIKQVQVTILGYVSAGKGEYLADDVASTETISGPVPKNYDFAVKINGDSMQPLLSNHQIIFVKKVRDCSEVRNNQIIIARIGNDSYVKKISISEEQVKLISLNPEYQDIEVTGNPNFKILGIVMI